MNRASEIKDICLSVLSNEEARYGDEAEERIAKRITTQIVANGYVRFDSIALDPQRCVQLLATILNGFKAEHPFVVIEKDEDTLSDCEGTCESTPETIS